jgi:hypothetical protein
MVVKMAKTSIDKRRKVRELEARRDALLVSKQKNVTELAKVRAELKSVKAR